MADGETRSFPVFPELERQARGEGGEEGGSLRGDHVGMPRKRASLGDPQPQAQTEDSK